LVASSQNPDEETTGPDLERRVSILSLKNNGPQINNCSISILIMLLHKRAKIYHMVIHNVNALKFNKQYDENVICMQEY